MEELTELQKKLEECRRHSDNHRRSRDYHKEQAADLREERETADGLELLDRFQIFGEYGHVDRHLPII